MQDVSDNIYVNYKDSFSLSGGDGNQKKGDPGSTPQHRNPVSSPHPGATVSLPRRIKVLMVVLSLSVLFLLCALGATWSLYASKSNQFDSLKAIHSNLSASLQNFKYCKPCPEGWVSHGGKCYFFSTDEVNWTQSRDHCVSMGGHLVIINSQEEQTFLYSSTKNKTHWIGLNDLETEGRWLWVDNKPLSQTGVQFWFIWPNGVQKEPDNWTTYDPEGEDCAALGNDVVGTYVWFDASCKQLKRFVCETDEGLVFNRE